MFCPKCAAENPNEAQFCGECGNALPRMAEGEAPNDSGDQPTAAASPTPATGGGTAQPRPASNDSNRMVVGLLAIFLGSLGIHKFLMGYHVPGVILLILGTVGWVLFVPGMVAVAIGIIEGVIYLSKSDDEFKRIYVENQKPWF